MMISIKLYHLIIGQTVYANSENNRRNSQEGLRTGVLDGRRNITANGRRESFQVPAVAFNDLWINLCHVQPVS